MKKKGFWEKLLKNSDDDEDSFQHLNPIEKDMIKGVVELSENNSKRSYGSTNRCCICFR